MIVIVKCLKKKQVFNINGRKFPDPMFEAAKQFMLEREKKKPFTVGVLMECKSWRGSRLYNTYHVLNGAGFHEYAEKLRTKFRERFDIDLNAEPVKENEPRT